MNSAVYIHRNVSFFIHYTLSVSFLSLQPTLSLQHQHVYNALMSPEASQPPPVFSQYNSPYLLPSLSPSTPRPPYCHTLENSQRSASPSPPQNRAHRSNFSTLYQMGCTYSYSCNSIPKECFKRDVFMNTFLLSCVLLVYHSLTALSLSSLCHRPGKPTSSLVIRASREVGDHLDQPFRPHSGSIVSQAGSRLPPTYQIISSTSNLRLNSGVYVPTHVG